MNTREVIQLASQHLYGLRDHIFDVLEISKPISPGSAVNLAKVISKLSPLLGNLIEFNIVELLNDQEDFKRDGVWIRQDPGFPDAIFRSAITPVPGFEIKAWFPISTEITARFRDSQIHLIDDNIYVVMLAWLPEYIIFGKPKIYDVCIVSGHSVAHARDTHYHNPPDYIVLEPEDTSNRTKNLQQTNTHGLKFQGSAKEFEEAVKIVASWGETGRFYQTSREYQRLLRELTARFPYRLDTNFAKIDRIVHPEIEIFKTRVHTTVVHSLSIKHWHRLLSNPSSIDTQQAIRQHLGIRKGEVDELLQ